MGRGVVEISGELLVDLFTQGWGSNNWVHCVEGLPEGTKCRNMYIKCVGQIDDPSLILGVLIEHGDLVDGEDYRFTFQRTQFEPNSVYKIQCKDGLFLGRASPNKRGGVYNSRREVTSSLKSGIHKNVEIVEYRLVEVSREKFSQ